MVEAPGIAHLCGKRDRCQLIGFDQSEPIDESRLEAGYSHHVATFVGWVVVRIRGRGSCSGSRTRHVQKPGRVGREQVSLAPESVIVELLPHANYNA